MRCWERASKAAAAAEKAEKMKMVSASGDRLIRANSHELGEKYLNIVERRVKSFAARNCPAC